MKLSKGLIHIYTGNGKGKTTAAVGLGVRAAGRGIKVLMVQFLKGWKTGEAESLKKLEPAFTLYRGAEGDAVMKFTWQMSAEELSAAKRSQERIFGFAKERIRNRNKDIDNIIDNDIHKNENSKDIDNNDEIGLLILDEIIGAVTSGLIELSDLTEFINNKPEHLEIVLTGRNPPPELLALADYVSEICAIKHPIDKGIAARVGIEL